MRHLLIALLCLSTCGLIAADGPSGSIAVLNLEAVLNNAKLFTARLERVKKDGAEAERQLDEMDKQEKVLKAQLDLLSKSKPEYGQLQEKLEIARLQRKLFTDRTRAGLERGQAEAVASSYEEIRGQLKAFAAEKGFRLVLQLPPGKLPTSSMQELLMQLGQQGVLYTDPSLDITEAFLAYVNARFAADGGAGAPAPAPGTDAGK